MATKNCNFCNGNLKYIYNLNDYRIVQCSACKTCHTETFPDDETLKNFYNGFKFCINEANKSNIVSDKFRDWLKTFNLPQNAQMLDIGGGGGYFSKLFEEYKFGKATYIDLDTEACRYAQSLNISKVINDDVCNIVKKNSNTYDFIYSRHVIEHITRPETLINSAISLLKEGGIFILQFPNGLSFERLIDKEHYRIRRKLLKQSNKNFSRMKIFYILHSDKTAFGLDPIKHLWAISPKGIKKYLDNIEGIEYTYKSYSIKDKIYSPYFINNDSYLRSILRWILSLINGKCHSVFIIKKSKVKYE